MVVFTVQPHAPPAMPPPLVSAPLPASIAPEPESRVPASTALGPESRVTMPASTVTHMPFDTLHTRPPVQSSFVSHSPHAPLGAQMVERHTLASVQVSPLGRPQRSSASKHTPLMHVRVPISGEHMPLAGPAVGTDMPFATFGAHTRLVGHHSVAPQSESTLQAVPHEPLTRSQSAPPAWPAQSAFDVQRPQMPIIAPVNAQKGVASEHAAPIPPKSAVQGPQVFVVALQNAVAPLHCALSTHCTQVFGVVADGPEQTRPSVHMPATPGSSGRI